MDIERTTSQFSQMDAETLNSSFFTQPQRSWFSTTADFNHCGQVEQTSFFQSKTSSEFFGRKQETRSSFFGSLQRPAFFLKEEEQEEEEDEFLDDDSDSEYRLSHEGEEEDEDDIFVEGTVEGFDDGNFDFDEYMRLRKYL